MTNKEVTKMFIFIKKLMAKPDFTEVTIKKNGDKYEIATTLQFDATPAPPKPKKVKEAKELPPPPAEIII